MIVFDTIKDISIKISNLKSENRTIGFVPTMGALHMGHISLINASIDKTDVTIVSIFVNPKQFNDTSDLENYPKPIDKDIKKLENANCDILFMPSEKEMYAEQQKEKTFDFGNIDSIMEGKHRPGHFKGVATVVSRFFDIIKPDKAFFGEKDFQQLAIINHIVKKYNYPVKIISCPIMREEDGLAMSSRNMLLDEKERRIAGYIYHILMESRKLMQELSVKELKQWVIKKINNTILIKVEYFEIVDSKTLDSISKWKKDCSKTGCIAVKIGKIRLIDNIKYNL